MLRADEQAFFDKLNTSTTHYRDNPHRSKRPFLSRDEMGPRRQFLNASGQSFEERMAFRKDVSKPDVSIPNDICPDPYKLAQEFVDKWNKTMPNRYRAYLKDEILQQNSENMNMSKDMTEKVDALAIKQEPSYQHDLSGSNTVLNNVPSQGIAGLIQPRRFGPPQEPLTPPIQYTKKVKDESFCNYTEGGVFFHQKVNDELIKAIPAHLLGHRFSFESDDAITIARQTPNVPYVEWVVTRTPKTLNTSKISPSSISITFRDELPLAILFDIATSFNLQVNKKTNI